MLFMKETWKSFIEFIGVICKMKELKKINIKGNNLDVEVCNTLLSRARGLMFKKKSRPLLFPFGKPTRQSIHSFFCYPFIAVWMEDGKIIEEKIVKPFSFSIRPKKPFTDLVEIPLRKDGVYKFFDGDRKI